MSKNIETYSIIQDRRRDLILCYREIAPNCVYQQTAWRKIAEHPAKRFYVTRKQVYQRLNAYLNGIYEAVDGLRNPVKRRMYQDLLQIVKDLAQKPENHGLGLRAICDKAVMMPAPCFYMTPRQVQIEFHNVTKNRIDKDGRNTVETLEMRRAENKKYRERYNNYEKYWK